LNFYILLFYILALFSSIAVCIFYYVAIVTGEALATVLMDAHVLEAMKPENSIVVENFEKAQSFQKDVSSLSDNGQAKDLKNSLVNDKNPPIFTPLEKVGTTPPEPAKVSYLEKKFTKIVLDTTKQAINEKVDDPIIKKTLNGIVEDFNSQPLYPPESIGIECGQNNIKAPFFIASTEYGEAICFDARATLDMVQDFSKDHAGESKLSNREEWIAHKGLELSQFRDMKCIIKPDPSDLELNLDDSPISLPADPFPYGVPYGVPYGAG
jgi:hypothetical protein